MAETNPTRIAGRFGGDADLQDAIARLTLLGVDRAEMTLPDLRAEPHPGLEDSAETPHTETDNAQIRTLGTSLAAAAAGMAATVAVVATGGAALPAVGAAVAAGLGAGGIAHAVSRGSDADQHETREAAAAEGGLVLWVLVREAGREAAVEQAMRQAHATSCWKD